MARTTYFTKATFDFLRDLGEHNDRDWFKANQDRYDAHVKEPALEFIEDFRPRLHGISRHFEANARTVGGSLFRIQRDTRFSKDKTPYKTNTGVHFRHELAADAHAPGFYLHIEPRNCFMGMGMWHPASAVAYQIRHWIDAHPDCWEAATRSPEFTDVLELSGDSLVRPPKGYDADHPLIGDLRRKDFMGLGRLTQAEVIGRDFADAFEARCRAGQGLVRFLCDAIGADF